MPCALGCHSIDLEIELNELITLQILMTCRSSDLTDRTERISWRTSAISFRSSPTPDALASTRSCDSRVLAAP
jgi:hypothetical protein